MTTPKINLSSAEVAEGSSFITSDGKTVTLKHVCIEAPKPRIDLSTAKIGDTIVTRSGLHGLITATSVTPGGRFFTQHAWYFDDGQANYGGSNYDAVELIRKREERVSIEKAGVGSRVRLRNGEVVKVTSLLSCAGDKNLNPYSFFNNGERYNGNEDYDVVEILELKPIEPERLSLRGIKPGSKVTLRNGDTYTFEGQNGGTGHYRLTGKDGLVFYFLEDGQCNILDKTLEVVKIDNPTVKAQISVAIKKIGKENIDRVVLGPILWERFKLEVTESPRRVDGVLVKYNSNFAGGDLAVMVNSF
jgi:hypothetical protein